MYKVVATRSNGKTKVLKENISFNKALDLIQLYESKDTSYIGFDLVNETGFDDLTNKFKDDYAQPDHMEQDLIKDMKSRKRHKLKKFFKQKNELTESNELDVTLEAQDIKVAIADYLNVDPSQCEFVDDLPSLAIKIKR